MNIRQHGYWLRKSRTWCSKQHNLGRYSPLHTSTRIYFLHPAVYDRMACLCLSLVGIPIAGLHYIKSTHQDRFGLGRQARLGRIWSMRRLFWRRGKVPVLFLSATCTELWWPSRYNDDISLEDAIHTALLTLKEGFEGQMTEKTIEIGVVTVPTPEELEISAVGPNVRPKPTFRKLSEGEVQDYLAL